MWIFSLLLPNGFLCLYINCFPIEVVMRFLDSLFYDGSIMLFSVALALFNINQKILLHTADDVEVLLLCRNLPGSVTDVNLLFEHAHNQMKLSAQKLSEYRKQGVLTVEKKFKEKQILLNARGKSQTDG